MFDVLLWDFWLKYGNVFYFRLLTVILMGFFDFINFLNCYLRCTFLIFNLSMAAICVNSLEFLFNYYYKNLNIGLGKLYFI